MEKSLIAITIAIILCFLGSFIGLKQISANNGKRTFWLLWTAIFAGWISLYFALPPQTDFISALYIWEIPSLAAISAVLYILLQKFPKFSLLILFLGAEIASFTLPANGMIFNGELDFWADRSTLILLWTIYAYCFSWLSTTNGITGAQSLGGLGGIGILSLIGGAPLFIGIMALCAISIFSAWQLFDNYPAKLKLSKADSWALGFILAWFNLKAATEGAGSCILCFNMFFAYQIIISLGRYFLTRGNKNQLSQNSDYYLIGLSGLTPAETTAAISKLLLLLIILGGFSAFAPNAYSLPIFALMSCIWFFHRLWHWKEAIPTLKEINNTVINDIKTNVSNFADGLKTKD